MVPPGPVADSVNVEPVGSQRRSVPVVGTDVVPVNGLLSVAVVASLVVQLTA